MRATIRSGMDRLSQATAKAFSNMREAAGESTDPEIIKYESFKTEDFDTMREMYGDDAVMDYIRTMEIRRAKNGGRYGTS